MCIILYLIIPDYYDLGQGFVMVICIPIVYVITKIMYKKGIITVEMPEEEKENRGGTRIMEKRDFDRIVEITDDLAPELKKLALDIHGNPEMGRKEFQACKWQMGLLEKYGFETEANFCEIETSYKAVYKGTKPGPKIAMLAEYDALPEIGHACGHNLIAMISVGSGIVIKGICR